MNSDIQIKIAELARCHIEIANLDHATPLYLTLKRDEDAKIDELCQILNISRNRAKDLIKKVVKKIK